MEITICFKNGEKLVITCEEFGIEKDIAGNPETFHIKGIEDNKPLYIDYNEIIYISRKLSET